MAQACHIDEGLVSDYERGLKVPSPATRRKITASLGVDPDFLERLALLCRGIRFAFERALRGGAAERPDDQQVEEKITAAVLDAMSPFFMQIAQLGGVAGPRAGDRAWADEQWEVLEPLAPGDQRLVASTLRSDRTWALAVRLCEASAEASDAAEKRRLAELAVDLAREVPEGSWRLRLLGWCEPFLAGAHRAAGNRKAAEEVFARADQHWEQGAGGDPEELLDDDQRQALKAALLS
jgi:transcriptional regulator with XRE-family HTH domain